MRLTCEKKRARTKEHPGVLGASRRSPSPAHRGGAATSRADHPRHMPHRTPQPRASSRVARLANSPAGGARDLRQSSPNHPRADPRGGSCARGRMVDGPESYESSEASVWLYTVPVVPRPNGVARNQRRLGHGRRARGLGHPNAAGAPSIVEPCSTPMTAPRMTMPTPHVHPGIHISA